MGYIPPMAFVDPERFKRFEQFVNRYITPLADAAGRGFAAMGPGVLIYYAPDDKFEGPVKEMRIEYRTKAQIDAAHANNRDELLQGMLDRYQPPGEVVILAIYPDNTYDITRAVVTRAEKPNLPN